MRAVSLVVEARDHPRELAARHALRDQRVRRARGRRRTRVRERRRRRARAGCRTRARAPTGAAARTGRVPRRRPSPRRRHRRRRRGGCRARAISSAASPAVAAAGSVIAGVLITSPIGVSSGTLRQHDAADHVLAREDAERPPVRVDDRQRADAARLHAAASASPIGVARPTVTGRVRTSSASGVARSRRSVTRRRVLGLQRRARRARAGARACACRSPGTPATRRRAGRRVSAGNARQNVSRSAR